MCCGSTSRAPPIVRAGQLPISDGFRERYLKGRYDLVVIDIYQQPSLAQSQEIIAAPTLVKSEPLPAKRLVGDFSNRERLVAGLGVEGETEGENPNG